MKRIHSVTALAVIMLSQSAAMATVHSSKYALEVHAFRTECAHFRLQGVSVAEPGINTGEPAQWFALARNHPNFNELFAILLTAKAGRQLLTVITDGGSACGYASVLGLSID